MVSWLVGQSFGWLVIWLVGWLIGQSVGRLVGYTFVFDMRIGITAHALASVATVTVYTARTDGRTDRRTDITSHRDARTHL